MLTINPQNVEALVFYDRAVQQLLPEFRDLFLSWGLGKRVPALRRLCQKAAFDLLEGLAEDHLAVLAAHLGSPVQVQATDCRLAKHADFDLACSGCDVAEFGWYDNWVVWRDARRLYVSTWR